MSLEYYPPLSASPDVATTLPPRCDANCTECTSCPRSQPTGRGVSITKNLSCPCRQAPSSWQRGAAASNTPVTPQEQQRREHHRPHHHPLQRHVKPRVVPHKDVVLKHQRLRLGSQLDPEQSSPRTVEGYRLCFLARARVVALEYLFRSGKDGDLCLLVRTRADMRQYLDIRGKKNRKCGPSVRFGNRAGGGAGGRKITPYSFWGVGHGFLFKSSTP